jgi:glycine cleavage system aminomethyltransferase T
LSEAWPVLGDAGEPVGRVTDAIWSPRLERNIGYVWVPIELAAPGTPIRVRTPDGEIDAHTAAIPFLDPTKKVPAS